MNNESTAPSNRVEHVAKSSGGRMTPKRIAAIICIILLVLMYLVTLFFAVFQFPGSDKLFIGCLAGTIVLPALCWVYIWLYGLTTKKKTIATVFKDAPSEEEVLQARIYQAEAEAAMQEKENK